MKKVFKSIFINLLTLEKWHLKVFLGAITLIIIIVGFLFTNSLVDEIIEREQNILKLNAKIYEKIFDPDPSNLDYLFLFDAITPTITSPMIFTDENDEPQESYEDFSKNIQIDSTLSTEEKRKFMKDYVAKMAENYDPILVKDQNGKVIQKLYYTHSLLVDKLRYFPLVALLIFSVFVAVGYFAFSTLRDNEQSKVWVGMAKEAAHQLGTPLSSMLAWIEILKYSKNEPDQVEDTLIEMQKDVNRLNKIATRFSKIGSTPEKSLHKLDELIEDVCIYFDARLPHLGKKVELIRNMDNNVYAEVNSDLIAWVFENLFKNAAEAIESKYGEIFIELKKRKDKVAIIYVKDTGKGMSNKLKRKIFFPGFTTKKRGWGLGLSLTKRIVEEYHQGKIYVKESDLNKGTTFAIELPLAEK
jgi:nitrogen-specific signal transduction histidine kinase